MLHLKNMKKLCTFNAGFCSFVRFFIFLCVCHDALYKLSICDVDAA